MTQRSDVRHQRVSMLGFVLVVLAWAAAWAPAVAQPTGTGVPEIVVQMGHSVGIHGGKISPLTPWAALGFPGRAGAGRLVATGANDGAVKLWDPISGREVRSLQMGQGSGVGGIAFSPDGRLIAASGERLARVWKVASGELVATFPDGPERTDDLAFSADGKQIAAGNNDKAVLWTVTGRTGIPVPAPAFRLAFGEDGRLALAGHRFGQARLAVSIWDPSTRRVVDAFEAVGDYPTAITVGPGGAVYVAGRPDVCPEAAGCRIVTVRTPAGGLRRLAGPPLKFTGAQFCADGRYLAAGDGVGRVVLWNVEAERIEREAASQETFFESVACTEDGRVLLGVGTGRVALWSGAGLAPDLTIYSEAATIEQLSVPGDSASLMLVARGSSKGQPQGFSITRWDVASIAPPEARRNLQFPAVAAPDLSWWLSGDEATKTVKVFARGAAVIDSGASIDESQAASDREGRHLAMATAGVLSTYSMPAFRREGRAETGLPHANPVTLTYSHDGRRLAASLGDGAVSLWRTPDLAPVCRMYDPKGADDVIWGVAFSPDGRLVATGGNARDITVWRAEDCHRLKVLPHGHTASVQGLVFSGDGSRLSSVAADGSVRVWDVATGRNRVLANNGWIVNRVAFAAKDRILITAGWENKANLWDAKTGEVLATLIITSDGQDWLIATPQGYFDGTAHAADLIGWRRPGTNEVTPLSRYYVDFLRPGLLAELLRGGRPRPSIDIAAAVGIPSLRTMLASSSGQARLDTRAGRARICLAAAPGVPLDLTPGDTARPTERAGLRVDPDDKACPFQINLDDVPRADVRRLVSARPAEAPLRRAPWEGRPTPPGNGRLRILTVAIDSYRESQTFAPLRYPKASAAAVRDALGQRAGGLFRQIVVEPPLEDAQASTRAVGMALQQLAAKAAPEDVVIIYLAGHGQLALGDEMFHFATWDSSDGGREQGLSTAVLADALRAFKARRILLVIDACQSGGSIEALQKVARARAAMAAERRDDAEAVGVYVLAASAPLSYALGADQSALAIAIAEAMRAPSALSVRDLLVSVETSLPEISQRVLKLDYKQTPLVVAVGADFPLAAAGR